MINWREKFIAFAIHFVATLAVALIAAGLFFFVWFPDPFHEMVGGSELFMLVAGCDLVLGPLLSLVIYNSRKSRRELYLDYSVVAMLQLGALAYGMYTSFNARPVYVAFVKDRLEVITASEIADEDLKEAVLPEYRTRPLRGPELVATHVKPEDEDDALWQGLEGKDVGVRPKFFVPYEAEARQIRSAAQELEALKKKHPEAIPLLAATIGDNPQLLATTKWLPVTHKTGAWTALVDSSNGRPIRYLPIDPF